MLSMQWPWVFLLLPLPWLVRYLIAPKAKAEAALKVASLSDWGTQTIGIENSQRNSLWSWLLPLLVWISLLVALAQPMWIGDPIRLPASGRDLMLAVDLSGSMDTGDMQLEGRSVNRLAVVKHVLNDFIPRREGDRLGLILFGSNAYLQSPLTFDRETVRIFMNESALGLAGKKTAIGEAIALGVKRLRDQPSGSRVMVLLTDGDNTAGNIEPLRAAELAAELDIRIYTIGLGSDSMKVPSFFGSRTINPSRDLDETTLTRVADVTGGKFFRARDTQELEQIYNIIDTLEPSDRDDKVYRPESSLFHWPLLLALLGSWLMVIMNTALPKRLGNPS